MRREEGQLASPTASPRPGRSLLAGSRGPYPKRLVDRSGGSVVTVGIGGVASSWPLQLEGETARPLSRGEHVGRGGGVDWEAIAHTSCRFVDRARGRRRLGSRGVSLGNLSLRTVLIKSIHSQRAPL